MYINPYLLFVTHIIRKKKYEKSRYDPRCIFSI